MRTRAHHRRGDVNMRGADGGGRLSACTGGCMRTGIREGSGDAQVNMRGADGKDHSGKRPNKELRGDHPKGPNKLAEVVTVT